MNQEWERDIFFDTSAMTIDEKKNLVLDAFMVCDRWNADILDCGVSFHRQGIDMPFEDIMKLLDDSCHFVVINRKGFPERFCGEVGFSTLKTEVSHFLFIYTSEEALAHLVNKYKLKKRE